MNLESPGRMPLTQWIAPRITSQYSATVGSRHQTNAHMLQTFSDGGHRWICDFEWFECPAALRLTNGLQYRHDLREFGNIGDHSHHSSNATFSANAPPRHTCQLCLGEYSRIESILCQSRLPLASGCSESRLQVRLQAHSKESVPPRQEPLCLC